LQLITYALGTVPLYERSAFRRDLHLKTHNNDNRQTDMPLAEFETEIPKREGLQAHALDRAATEICCDKSPRPH
jgi:hypothetical protein